MAEARLAKPKTAAENFMMVVDGCCVVMVGYGADKQIIKVAIDR